MPEPEQVALHDETRRRYLNYAMSVITSRALPDVRDGLKPVQRRILYAMFHNLRLLPGGRYRKSAAVVGEVMAKYHPHGDSAIYDAMVRMAQSFSLRHPLVDGQGNFGSMDGDSAAAMRYTECRLTAFAIELLDELGQQTVDYRPTYDGQLFEPIVLPASLPHLLINGTEGIAVGMATRIPPHNLREVIDACLLLIDEPEATSERLATKVRGPDFPTGGLILSSREDLLQIYTTGSGPVRIRGEWVLEKKGRKDHVVITSVPYAQNKATLVEKIGELIAARKVPQLVDVRDESTEDIRVVLELRSADDAAAAMAFLLKHTPLQQTFHANITALIPTTNTEVAAPARLDLRSMLREWLDFRLATVRRRFEYELGQLRERIHILEGFEAIFVDLDEAIRIIRDSEGRKESSERLMARFGLDDIQVDAILELKLYRLSRLEIIEIREELAEKRERAQVILEILADQGRLWKVIHDELLDIRKRYGNPRRTSLCDGECEEPAYHDDAYIVAEDAIMVVTRDGWIKRQSSFSSVERIRVREGDSIAWLYRASTRSTVAFFTDRGSAYVLRVESLPATPGYGEPIQRHFQFADGEKVVGVLSLDPRNLPCPVMAVEESSSEESEPPPPYAVAITREGRIQRFPLAAHAEISTRNGRRFMRVVDGEGGVFIVQSCPIDTATDPIPTHVSVATLGARVLAFPLSEVKVLRGAARGLQGIHMRDDDRVLAFGLSRSVDEGVLVRTPRGKDVVVCPRHHAGHRGDRGAALLKKANLLDWQPEAVIRPGERRDGARDQGHDEGIEATCLGTEE